VRRRQVRALLLAQVIAWVAGPAAAWVYPEHRDIAVLAVESLDPERRAVFDRLWADARLGHEPRLCAAGADLAQGAAPTCIDWAAMSAISGDHSCSSKEMLATVMDSEWILAVADVGAQLKLDLSRITAEPPVKADKKESDPIGDLRRQFEHEVVRAERTNALRVSDVRLQRADPQYATRAGSNNAHFLLARPTPEFTGRDYVEATLRPGSEINALGVFGWFHLSALQKATRLAHESLAAVERSALARSMLADEAFALHFLEDSYSSGHVAGTWGDVSQRKGTHDFYNENGLEVDTWEQGEQSIVLMGDAHMRPEDAHRAGESVRLSLEQLLDTAAGRRRNMDFPVVHDAPSEPDGFDVCKNNRLVARPEALRAGPEAVQFGIEVLRPTPIPGLGEGLGSMPRFRAEVGPFVGVAGQLDLRHIDGGFTGFESGGGYIGGADLALRVGYGLEGVLGEAGDGLAFFSVGYRGDTQSSNKFTNASFAEQGGSLTAAIPARTALTVRLRMPFYLIPGDVLLLSPLYFASPTTYQHMAVTAANGGVIPWQLGWATRFGRFQFVLGREIGVTFYGQQAADSLLAPGDPPGVPRVIRFKSTHFDFPFLEFRPFRAFDSTQSSEVVVQLFAGIDDPHGEHIVFPEGSPEIKFDRLYTIGVRLRFDWRRYF
jgi:hypothetical protein